MCTVCGCDGWPTVILGSLFSTACAHIDGATYIELRKGRAADFWARINEAVNGSIMIRPAARRRPPHEFAHNMSASMSYIRSSYWNEGIAITILQACGNWSERRTTIVRRRVLNFLLLQHKMSGLDSAYQVTKNESPWTTGSSRQPISFNILRPTAKSPFGRSVTPS